MHNKWYATSYVLALFYSMFLCVSLWYYFILFYVLVFSFWYYSTETHIKINRYAYKVASYLVAHRVQKCCRKRSPGSPWRDCIWVSAKFGKVQRSPPLCCEEPGNHELVACSKSGCLPKQSYAISQLFGIQRTVSKLSDTRRQDMRIWGWKTSH